MASTYTREDVAEYLAWYLRGDDLAIITNKYDSTTNANSEYVAIDESVTNGIMIEYLAEPDAVTAVTDTPDIDNTLHLSLVDYVKFRLYLDKAGKEDDSNKAMMSERLAQMFEKKWNDGIKRFGMKKRDKVGGGRVIIPVDFR